MRGIARPIVLGAVAALSLGVSACELKDDGDNLVAGKEAFVQKCGSCHALARAGTSGVTGPNLDAAFARALLDGQKRSTIETVVHGQIGFPNPNPQVDPKTGEIGASMPADIVEGELAEDVAAYVAYATGRKGEDTGRLAEIGVKKAEGVAKAENGELEIPADPGGGLAYAFAAAEAPPGQLTIKSPNESSVPHNIAIDGGPEGEIVSGGGVSEISQDFAAGEYTFYCSVPGHREGGMEGKLTVK